jgi:tetratricopeptide (TPR) repeat protein
VTALRAGVWDFLRYPRNPEELSLTLQVYVQAKRNIDVALADDVAEPTTVAQRVLVARLRAGRGEENAGPLTQARAWYEVALRVAEGLRDRRPEVESLRALGYVCLALGHSADGARYFQRSLALADAESDSAGAIDACKALGDAALAQGQWAGAQAWYGRALRLANAARDPELDTARPAAAQRM